MNRLDLRAHSYFDEPVHYHVKNKLKSYPWSKTKKNGTYKVLFSWRKAGILMYTEASVRGFLTSYIHSGGWMVVFTDNGHPMKT